MRQTAVVCQNKALGEVVRAEGQRRQANHEQCQQASSAIHQDGPGGGAGGHILRRFDGTHHVTAEAGRQHRVEEVGGKVERHQPPKLDGRADAAQQQQPAVGPHNQAEVKQPKAQQHPANRRPKQPLANVAKSTWVET